MKASAAAARVEGAGEGGVGGLIDDEAAVVVGASVRPVGTDRSSAGEFADGCGAAVVGGAEDESARGDVDLGLVGGLACGIGGCGADNNPLAVDAEGPVEAAGVAEEKVEVAGLC